MSTDTRKQSVDALLARLASVGWSPGLTQETYEHICAAGFRGEDSRVASAILTELALDNQPLTLRSLMYRAVSVGLFPSTDSKWYDKTGRLASRMRRQGLIPYSFIVDNLRSTQKPSSWSGLEDFAETVRKAYRKDFWAQLPHYVHVLCEKDALAGSIALVTREYDVPLSPIRGYISDSYAYELGSQWREITKPIFVYYLGDYDPSGFDLERDAREKLEGFAGRSIIWTRLGVNEPDFDDHGLIELKVKTTDTRWKTFVEEHGERCAEVDALPPPELRSRVREAIEQHIPKAAWERLKQVEELEKETLTKTLIVPPANTGEVYVTKQEAERLTESVLQRHLMNDLFSGLFPDLFSF